MKLIMEKWSKPLCLIIFILLPCSLFGQKQHTIELAKLYKNGKLKAVNRNIEIVSGDSGAYLKISESKKEETFPTLPYKTGLTFIIPFYDPGTASGYQRVAYAVTGSAELTGYDNQKIDCWLMVHEAPGNKEVYWISKKTNEVLKLEQEVNGKMYRYKIKLGFSI